MHGGGCYDEMTLPRCGYRGEWNITDGLCLKLIPLQLAATGSAPPHVTYSKLSSYIRGSKQMLHMAGSSVAARAAAADFSFFFLQHVTDARDRR